MHLVGTHAERGPEDWSPPPSRLTSPPRDGPPVPRQHWGTRDRGGSPLTRWQCPERGLGRSAPVPSPVTGSGSSAGGRNPQRGQVHWVWGPRERGGVAEKGRLFSPSCLCSRRAPGWGEGGSGARRLEFPSRLYQALWGFGQITAPLSARFLVFTVGILASNLPHRVLGGGRELMPPL